MTEEKPVFKKAERCTFCIRQPLFDGAGINLISMTESGEIVTPFETEDSSASIMLPMCAYHMVLAQQGVIAITTNNKIISARKLGIFETLTDAQLKIRSKLVRNSKELEHEAHLAKAVVEARQFQTGMDKEIEKQENKQ